MNLVCELRKHELVLARDSGRTDGWNQNCNRPIWSDLVTAKELSKDIQSFADLRSQENASVVGTVWLRNLTFNSRRSACEAERRQTQARWPADFSRGGRE